jgi:hypothetical protein
MCLPMVPAYRSLIAVAMVLSVAAHGQKLVDARRVTAPVSASGRNTTPLASPNLKRQNVSLQPHDTGAVTLLGKVQTASPAESFALKTAVRMRNQRPFAKRSLTKSMLQRWFGRVAPPRGTRVWAARLVRFLVRTCGLSSHYNRCTRLHSLSGPRAAAEPSGDDSRIAPDCRPTPAISPTTRLGCRDSSGSG